MTTNVSVLKCSENETVYKLSGAGETTIALDSGSILASTQLKDGNTQVVDITGFAFTGALDGVITIVRNNVTIATAPAASSNFIDLAGQLLPPDTTEHSFPIVVTITNQAELWLKLRKVSGYKSKVEPSVYGEYDDPTLVGASTTKSGSPDYVGP
jgi:hypothetical protein